MCWWLPLSEWPSPGRGQPPSAASHCGNAGARGPARASGWARPRQGSSPFLRFKVQTQTALGRWVPPQVKNQNRRGGACRGQCDWQPLPARTGRSSHCGGRPRDSAARAASDRRRTPSEPLARSGSRADPCAPVPSHGVAASVGLWPFPPEQITCTVQCQPEWQPAPGVDSGRSPRDVTPEGCVREPQCDPSSIKVGRARPDQAVANRGQTGPCSRAACSSKRGAPRPAVDWRSSRPGKIARRSRMIF